MRFDLGEGGGGFKLEDIYVLCKSICLLFKSVYIV